MKNILSIACVFVASTAFGQFEDSPWKKENTQNRNPIPYTHIREADVMWSKRVWRTIDLREKFNHPLYYPTSPINNRKSLFDVIKEGILSEEIYAFDNPLFVDDFSIRMTKTQVVDLFYQTDSILQEDPYNPGTYNKVVIVNELLSADIVQWWVKEDWYFNKQTSTMEVRILGLCPLKAKSDPSTGEVIGVMPLFWVYFPQCRPLLARNEVFNSENDAQRMSYDDLFMKRMFASYIFKESNVYNVGGNDRPINSYCTGVEALMEADRVKEDISNKEHDVWHF
jgi:gliding motility associated protien GldN